MKLILEKFYSTWYNLQQKRDNYVSYIYDQTKRGYGGFYWLNKYSCYGRNFWHICQENKNIFRRRDENISRTRSTNFSDKVGSKKTPVDKHTPKVVLDSSIYVNAAISPDGNSGNIVKLAKRKVIQIFISDYILEETIENLREKAASKDCERHSRNMAFIHPKNFSPPENYIEAYINFIHPGDAPILALAAFVEADFLITLNTKHFIDNPKLKLLDLPFKIFTPGDFIVFMGGEMVRS